MDPFLEDLKRRTLALTTEQDRLAAELEFIEKEIDRLGVAADVYRAFQKGPDDVSEKKPSLVEAIERVLRQRGGFGRIPDLYTILLNERLMNAKNKRSAYNQVYAALHQREDKFREVGSGLWALVDTAQSERVHADIRSDNVFAAHGKARVTGSAELGAPNGHPESSNEELTDLLDPEPTRETDNPDGDPGWTRVGGLSQ